MEIPFNCYLYKWGHSASFEDVEAKFSHLSINPRTDLPYRAYMRYVECKGLEGKGSPKNIYTESFVDSDYSRVSIGEALTRESTKLDFTFIFFGAERQDLYQDFFEFVSGAPLIYWDNVRKRAAVMLLNSALSPNDDTYLTSVPRLECVFSFSNYYYEAVQCETLEDALIWGRGVLAEMLRDTRDYMYVYNNNNRDIFVKFEVYDDGSGASALPEISLEYSIDKVNWYSLTDNLRLCVPAVAGKVYLRASEGVTNVFGYIDDNGDGIWRILNAKFANDAPAPFHCGGDIMSLVRNTDERIALPDCALTGLFMSTSIITAPKCSALNIGDYGMLRMFDGCDMLVSGIPELNVNAIGDSGCKMMYYDCSSLKEAGSVAAESIGNEGCVSMFAGCASLVYGIRTDCLHISTYSYSYMYRDCTSLVYVYDLPVENVPDNAYNSMFYRCTSLRKAPKIYASSLGKSACASMFYGCTSLRSSPDISCTTIGINALQGMFSSSGIRTAPNITANNIGTYAFANMFSECSSLETLPNVVSASTTAGVYQRMFYKCTSLSNAVQYSNVSTNMESMYYGCTGLVEIVLRKSLISSYMFKDCTNLVKVTFDATTAPSYNNGAGVGAFDGNHTGRTIYVPQNLLSSYRQSFSAYSSDIQPIV